MRITLVTLIFLFLAGCSLPYLKKDTEILSYDEYKKALFSKKTNQFKINGKLSLFVNKKGQSGKILWNFENEKDTIDIFNPFNSKIAEIILYEPEKKVVLNFTKNNNQDSEELISKIFGKKDNIFFLKKFIINPPQQLLKKNNITIKYKNWNVQYQGKKIIKNRLVPKIIVFKKNNISLKIFISDLML